MVREALDAYYGDLTDQLHMALEASGLGTWRWDMASGALLILQVPPVG